MKVMVVSANLGHLEKPVTHVQQVVPQDVELSYKSYTDENYPVRLCAMTPRLQAHLPKCFAWDMLPGFDRYIWVDGAFQFNTSCAIAWLLNQLGEHEFACFRHPNRQVVYEESQFLADMMVHSRRLQKRYQGEFLDAQMQAVKKTLDAKLLASGILAYKPTLRVESALTNWWLHITRFHLDDQLSLPFVLDHFGCDVGVIDADIYHDARFLFTRNGIR